MCNNFSFAYELKQRERVYLLSSQRETLISWCWLFFFAVTQGWSTRIHQLFPFQMHHKGASWFEKKQQHVVSPTLSFLPSFSESKKERGLKALCSTYWDVAVTYSRRKLAKNKFLLCWRQRNLLTVKIDQRNKIVGSMLLWRGNKCQM